MTKDEDAKKATKKIMETGNAIYYEDGTVEIFGDKSGLPEFNTLVPAPHCDEPERQRRYRKAIEQITLQGYMILETKRVRNDAFDKKDQKTSLKIVARACKTEDEIKAVHENIMEIINKGALEQVGVL